MSTFTNARTLLPRYAVKETWRAAIRKGHVPEAVNIIKNEDVSPSLATEFYGTNPLKDLVTRDNHPEFFAHQAILASVLIAHGTELGVPDRYSMIPADYAYLSRNEDAAVTIILHTIDHFIAHRQKPYRPHVAPYFATCVDDYSLFRFEQMQRVHDKVGSALLDLPQDSEEYPHIVQWTAKDKKKIHDVAFWTDPCPHTFDSLPQAPNALLIANMEREKVRLGGHVNEADRNEIWALRLERAVDRLFLQESRAARRVTQQLKR